MGFFLNHIYSIWKLHFWRFPEMFCHQQKVVDHQSGQAKNENFRFWTFFKYYFQKFHFFSWNDIFSIGNWIIILSSLWKLHFWGFPEIQKRNWRFDIFISWKKCGLDIISRAHSCATVIFWMIQTARIHWKSLHSCVSDGVVW